MRTAVLVLALASACGNVASPPPPERPALQSILAEKKFQPDNFYTGVDTPEDWAPLQQAVDSAIGDIAALPEPLEEEAVRERLSELIDQTYWFATEDRDQVYRYAVRIWRAAGSKEESGLFALPDDQVLADPEVDPNGSGAGL